MRKKNYLKWLLSFSLGLGVSAPAMAHTVQEAVGHALKTGPDILISANAREAVEEELRQAFAGYLPTLDLNAGWGRERSNNATTRGPQNLLGSRTLYRTEFGLAARQMLFDGFAVKNDVEGNMARVRAESWRVNNDAQEIALNTITSFLEVNLRKELVRWARLNLNAHQKIFSQIEKRSDGLVGNKADLDQASARLALARTNFLAEQANLVEAEARYLRLVGIPAIELTQPESPTVGFPETLRSAIALGVNNHPELRAAVSDVGVARAANKAAKAAYFPRLDLELGFNQNHNVDGTRGDNDDFFGMLRVRWNLFKGGADVANVKRTAWKIEEAKEVRNRAHRQTEESVRLAWSTYSTSKAQVPHTRTYQNASLRTRDSYQKQFNIGQRTLLDLLDTENELFGARTTYSNSKHQELLGRFRVLQSTGALLDYLGVPLPRAARLSEPSLLGYSSHEPHYYDQFDRTNWHGGDAPAAEFIGGKDTVTAEDFVTK